MGALFSEAETVIKFAAVFSLPLLILSSCYMLKFLHCAFMGEGEGNYNDISVHEFVVLASITAGLIIFGIFPSVLLNLAGGQM